MTRKGTGTDASVLTRRVDNPSLGHQNTKGLVGRLSLAMLREAAALAGGGLVVLVTTLSSTLTRCGFGHSHSRLGSGGTVLAHFPKRGCLRLCTCAGASALVGRAIARCAEDPRVGRRGAELAHSIQQGGVQWRRVLSAGANCTKWGHSKPEPMCGRSVHKARKTGGSSRSSEGGWADAIKVPSYTPSTASVGKQGQRRFLCSRCKQLRSLGGFGPKRLGARHRESKKALLRGGGGWGSGKGTGHEGICKIRSP